MLRKPPYLIIVMVFYLAPATCHADGRIFRYGDNAAYRGQPTSPAYSQTTSPNRIIGPFTSFNNAYGPVPAFGLRNYPSPGKSDFSYGHHGFEYHYNTLRRGYHDNKRTNRKSRNIFGYTYNPGSAEVTE